MAYYNSMPQRPLDVGCREGLPGKWWEILALAINVLAAMQTLFITRSIDTLRVVYPCAVVGALLSFALLFSPLVEHVWGRRVREERRPLAFWAVNRVSICLFLVSSIYLYQAAVFYTTVDIQRLFFYVPLAILLHAYAVPYFRNFAFGSMPLAILVVGLFTIQTAYPGNMSDGVQKHNLEAASRSLAALSEIAPLSGNFWARAASTGVFLSPLVMLVFLAGIVRSPYVLRGATFSAFCALAFLVAPYSAHFQQARPMLPASLTTLFSGFTLYHSLVWGWLLINLVGLPLISWTYRRGKRNYELSKAINKSLARAGSYTYEMQSPTEPQNPSPAYQPGRKMAEPKPAMLDAIKSEIIGQDEALKRLWENVVVPAWHGQRKFGNALVLGPTGVGKTQTAKVIANYLFDGRLARFDMNQFSSEYDAPKLIGAAPGYVGHNEPSRLNVEVNGKSPCVILFDEIEKTHPIAIQMLLQLCGEGYVVDTHGIRIDATQSIILMTSNIWPERADVLWQVPAPQLKKELADVVQSRYQHHQNQKLFSPEFIGRLHEAIAYQPFGVGIAEQVVGRLTAAAKERHRVEFAPDFCAVMAKCASLSDGYRGIAMLYENTAEKMLTQRSPRSGSVVSAKREAGKLIVQVSSKGKVVDQEEMLLASVPAFAPAVLETLAEKVQSLVKGQDAQIDEIVSLVRISAAGLRANTGRPYGVFLLAGPTGVGKTETAKALARELFGGRMVKHDMGELKNYNDGVKFFGDRYKPGSLTTAVSELGSCVVLLDEIEKANPEVFDSFLSLFDDGRMSDAASGVSVSFKETIVLMTTNLQPDYAFAQSQAGVIDLSAPLSGDVRRNLFAYHFRKELLGRIDQVILYSDLSTEAVAGIMRMRVESVLKSLHEDKGVEVAVEEAVYDTLAGKLKASSYGVRGLDVFLRDELFSILATKALTETKVHLVVHEGNLMAEAISAV